MAILMAMASGALTGCARVYPAAASATAAPVFGAEDPEQPQSSSDCSGLIVSVTHEQISLLPSAPCAEDAGEAPPAAGGADSGERLAFLSFPLADGVRIRQSRGGESAELVNLQPYEIIPGFYAEVWLDPAGSADYIRVSVRMRLEA